MFILHEQYTSYEYFLHRAFGLLAILTGALKGISEAYPKFTLMFLFFGLYTPVTFISAAPSFFLSAMIKRMAPENYVFLQSNLVFLWMLFLCVFARYAHRLVPKFIRQANVYTKMEDESEMTNHKDEKLTGDYRLRVNHGQLEEEIQSMKESKGE